MTTQSNASCKYSGYNTLNGNTVYIKKALGHNIFFIFAWLLIRILAFTVMQIRIPSCVVHKNLFSIDETEQFLLFLSVNDILKIVFSFDENLSWKFKFSVTSILKIVCSMKCKIYKTGLTFTYTTHHSLTHCFLPLLTHSFTYKPLHSFTPSLLHSFTHSLTQSLNHSITQSLNHSLTHSLTP